MGCICSKKVKKKGQPGLLTTARGGYPTTPRDKKYQNVLVTGTWRRTLARTNNHKDKIWKLKNLFAFPHTTHSNCAHAPKHLLRSQTSQSHYCFFFVHSETLARPRAFLWEFEAMTTSFGSANTALLKDPKLQIPSFRGLRSSGSLALARHARSISVSSPSPSAIRAVSTVRFCSDFLFISLSLMLKF